MRDQAKAYTSPPPPASTTGAIHPASAAVLAALQERGTSARAWGMARGYMPRTVYACIRFWVPRTDRPPHGGLAREIREALRADLGDALVPPVGAMSNQVQREAA